MNTPTTPRRPSYGAMAETLDRWHAESLDDAEYIWLTPSFEDMADSIRRAQKCAAVSQDFGPDNGWIARQDAAVARRV